MVSKETKNICVHTHTHTHTHTHCYSRYENYSETWLVRTLNGDTKSALKYYQRYLLSGLVYVHEVYTGTE